MTNQPKEEYCKVPVRWLETLLKYSEAISDRPLEKEDIMKVIRLIGYCSSAKTILKYCKHE